MTPLSLALDAAATAVSPQGTEALLLDLFIMLGAAKLCAEVFIRLRQPSVVGEILAGVAIGPYALGWVLPSDMLHLLAEIGVMFLLFSVGLETRPSSILRVGRTAALVAVLGVVVPFAGGYAAMRAYGETGLQAAMVATALVATSIGITARVLAELGLMETASARVILGAAVIDDVLGLMVLAVVANAAKGQVNLAEITTTAALAAGFVGITTFVGAPAVTRAAPYFGRLRQGNALFFVALLVCLGLAVISTIIGVAAIIGAFLAGMVFAEASEGDQAVHRQVEGVTEFLVPFFMVNIGLMLDLRVFANRETLLLALLLTLIAVVTKLAGCALAAAGLGVRGAMQVGAGMVPRGEVGIVVAQMALAMGIVDEKLFGALLFMACATTLIAPPLIRAAFARTATGVVA